MKIGAIDIGSNAIRFQITNVIDYKGIVTFKKVEYVRFPLRLGQDVFKYNRIMESSENKFVKLMATFKMLLELYEVDDYIFCATSAMRESENGVKIAERVKREIGVEIDIIDGDREAEIINKVIFNRLDDRNYIHIDVGGGSTELNILSKKEKVAAQSFKIGSVRRLGGDDSPKEWDRMKTWVNKHVTIHQRPIMAIGTGGNISKLYDLANITKVKNEAAKIHVNDIEDVRKELNKYTLEERINVLMLNPDRADVILPACDIYTSVMKWAGAHEILVPDVGLKDGLLQLLYERSKTKLTKDRPPLF